jgi:hypothetical protein
MSAHVTTLMISVVTVVFTSCASYAAPEVSGPYGARLTREDIQQIAALPFAGSGINRGVHSIYANKPDEVGVQSAQPQWPRDTIVSFTARKKDHHWVIVPGSIETMQMIPTD